MVPEVMPSYQGHKSRIRESFGTAENGDRAARSGQADRLRERDLLPYAT
jgi:hypothetical protein